MPGDVDPDPVHGAALVRARARAPCEVVAGQRPVERDLAAEQQLRVAARDEAHDERPELVRLPRLDLDAVEPVQAHQPRQRVRAVRRTAEAARDRRRVDRVIPVRVADQHAGHRPRRAHVALDQRRVRQRRPAQQQRASAARATRTGRRRSRRPRTSAGSRRRRATRSRARPAARAEPARARAAPVRSSHRACHPTRRGPVAPHRGPRARARPARRASRPSCPPTRRRRSTARPRRRARTPAGSTRSACSSTPARTCPSPLVAALHEAALAAQPSMGYPGDKYQAGLEPIDVVEVTAARRRGARDARALRRGPPDERDARQPRGLHRARAARRHDRGPARLGRRPPQPPRGRRARRARPARRAAALRRRALDVDLDALDEFLARERPVARRRRREPDAVPAPAARRSPPLVHGTCAAALRRLARRRADRRGPLPGPARRGRRPRHVLDLQVLRRAAPAARSSPTTPRSPRRVATAVYPGPGGQLRRLAARAAGRRGARARALRRRATPTSASPTPRALAAALAAAGFDVGSARRAASPRPTTSRSTRAARRRHGRRAAARRGQRAAERDRHPDRRAGGLRIGTQAITRQGFAEEDMPADRRRSAPRSCRGRAAERVRRDVAALRRRH